MSKIFSVPAGTRLALCKGCQKPIYWIEYPGVDKKTKQPKTIRNPIDCSGERNTVPTADADGSGISHYETCPSWRNFKKPAK